VGGDFILQYLQFEPQVLAKHFDAYATNHSGLNGMSQYLVLPLFHFLILPGIIHVKSSEAAKGDKKTSMKAVIMQMLRKQYRAHIIHRILFLSYHLSGGLVTRYNPRLDWTKWAKGEPDASGVILRGWPLQEPPTALSHIRNTDDMQTILNAIVRRECLFELVKPDKGDNTGDGTHSPSNALRMTTERILLLATTYHPGGTILRFSNESATTMETRSTRKRNAHADTIDSGKENQAPLDAISAAQPPLKRIRTAEPTQHPSGQGVFPSSPQSPSCSLTMPPAAGQDSVTRSEMPYTGSISDSTLLGEPSLCSIADTVGSACGLTLPPATGQATVTSSEMEMSYPTGSISGLTSLGYTSLYTFPTDTDGNASFGPI
jgi:hypothetical protein